MSKRKTALIITTLAGLGLAGGLALSDDDRYGEWYERVARDVAPVSNASYAEECGSCHLAYPPGLLPAPSWQRIMDGLADHFGENAELLPATAAEIRAYLNANAAGRSFGGRPGFAARLPVQAPLRITETAYFRAKHHELPRRAVQDNPEVGSFSRCTACHAGAADGSFNEHAVRVPGFGRWED
ncbi:MAG: diheme cytochrome c [Chromatiales bacterium]|jgi:hypothetical protein